MVKGWLPLTVGILAVVLGAVWTLQGLDKLGGSVMSGVTIWAVIGPIVAVVGLVLIVIGVRRRAAAKAAGQPPV
jgi:predicted permease